MIFSKQEIVETYDYGHCGFNLNDSLLLDLRVVM